MRVDKLSTKFNRNKIQKKRLVEVIHYIVNFTKGGGRSDIM